MLIYRVVFSACIFILVACVSTQAQMKWLDDQPGKIDKKYLQTIKGFNTAGITTMVNKIPVIQQPVGYDVVESEVAFNDRSGPIHGRVGIGISRLYLFKGKQDRQGEYPQVGFLLNRLSELMRESYFLSEDTRKANLPAMYSDTMEFRSETRNGQQVWVSTNQPDYEYQIIMINPKGKPCFIPATKEQLVKLWISKLSIEIDKYRKLIEDNKSYLADQKGKTGNEQVIKNLEEGIISYNLWLDYILQKKKAYEDKLASLSAAERNQPAEVGMPVNLAATVKKGKQVEKVTGDMRDELIDMMPGSVTKKHGVYIYNPDFFDPKLPRTAIQLILIKDTFKIGERFDSDQKVKKLLKEKFFPELDYKALAGMMYK